jgi:hypothetical protein
MFVSSQIVAQSQYDFMGFLFMEDYRPISYRLLLEEKDGIVNGYSITGEGTSFETKSELSGTFLKKEMKLNEFQIISTISEEPLSNFCFIDLTVTKNKKGFSGEFIGKFPDGKQCAEGTIVFAKKSKLEKKIKKAKKIQEVLTKRAKSRPVLLRSGDSHHINFKNDKLRIELWDSALEDNDRISVLFNDKIVVDNKIMRNKKEVLELRLKQGENIFEFIAQNEGKSPSNTTRVELIGKKVKYPLLTDLKVGEKVEVIINFEQ